MLNKLKEILGKVLPDIDLDTITENTRLAEDLGFDSLAMIMMAMELEDAEFVRFKTVGDVCGYLESRI